MAKLAAVVPSHYTGWSAATPAAIDQQSGAGTQSISHKSERGFIVI